jgi:ketosteroid isomerase-like protein
MSTTPALDAVTSFYAAYRERDEDKLRSLLSATVEWNQCEGFPGGARRRGIQEVMEGILGSNEALWGGFGANVGEYLCDGETVVVLGHYSWRAPRTNDEMKAIFAHVYRVRQGMIVRFDQIVDTAVMAHALI